MEDPMYEQEPDEPTPTSTEADPSVTEAEVDPWAAIDSGTSMQDDPSDGSAPGYDTMEPAADDMDGADDASGTELGNDPHEDPMVSAAAGVATEDDEFDTGQIDATAPVDDLTRLRLEASETQARATTAEDRAALLDERVARIDEWEANRVERADELRSRAREVAQEGRRERAAELRDHARRAAERAERARERSEDKGERSAELIAEAAAARAEASALEAQAAALEAERGVVSEPPPSVPTPADEGTVDYGVVSPGPPPTPPPVDEGTVDYVVVSQGPPPAPAEDTVDYGVVSPPPPIPSGSIADAISGIHQAGEEPPVPSVSIADVGLGVVEARIIDDPISLSDIEAQLDDAEVAEIVGNLSAVDLGEAGPAVQAAVTEALAQGGSPVQIGQAVVERLAGQVGDEVRKQVGEALTGALGGMLEGGGQAGQVGKAVVTAIDNVIKGESPVEAVKQALDAVGYGQYGPVAERAINVAIKIADGDFAGAAREAGLEDELDPVLGAYRITHGLANGDTEEVLKGITQSAGYKHHVEAAQRALEGDFGGAGAEAVRAFTGDMYGAAAEQLAKGDALGAAKAAAEAGGYADYYNTIEHIGKGNWEEAAVAAGGAVGGSIGVPGLGGTVDAALNERYTEATLAAAGGAAGATVAGPIGATLGEFGGRYLGSWLGAIGVDDAFKWAGGAAGDAAEAAVGAGEDIIEGAGEIIEDGAEVFVDTLEDLNPANWFD